MKISKKALSFVMVLVLGCALFAGCSSGGSSAASSANAAPASSTASSASTAPAADAIVLKMGLSHNEESPNYIGSKAMADYVFETSGGRLQIDIYAANALGEEKELMEGLIMGTVDMALLPPGIVASYDSGLQVFDLPFLFENWDHVDKVLYGEIGEQLIQSAEEKANIKIFNFCEGGFRSLVNNVRPIHSPSDLKGLKIRVPDWKGLVRSVEMMGGIPTVIPFGEVYTACASGLVDGQEGTAFAMRANKFYEVCTYYSIDRHIYNPMMFCGNVAKFNNLDAELQQILLDGCIEGGKVQTSLVRDNDEADMKFLAENGMEINEVNDPGEFAALTVSIYDEFTDVVDPAVIQAIITLK